MDLEKFRLVLADVTDCAALIAAVFVADTVAFHVIPRLVDIWTHMKPVEKNKYHIRLINLPSIELTFSHNLNLGNTSPVPLRDFLRFFFSAVAAIWVMLRFLREGSSLNPIPPIAAWIVFRFVTDYFGLALTPQDRVNEFLRQQGSDESKGRGLAWNYWTGFLERFCTALSTSQLDFETKKLLMIPRSFQKQKYDDWKGISEVGELKFSATSDKTKDQRRDIALKVYAVRESATGRERYFVPDFPQILKSLDGRNANMGEAAREVVLRSFTLEVQRLMECAKRRDPSIEIPDIVEYDDRSSSHSLPSVLNQYFMKSTEGELH